MSIGILGNGSGCFGPSGRKKEAAVFNKWEPYSFARFEELREKNIPVFVDFTAKWCLICQANALVLSHPEVETKFNDLGVVRMKADWTRYDPGITEELRKHGRSGVPLYLFYDFKSEGPVILPQLLTPEGVIAALEPGSSYVR